MQSLAGTIYSYKNNYHIDLNQFEPVKIIKNFESINIDRER